MALADSLFVRDLINAFKAITWDGPSGHNMLLGQAFDNYIKSGTVTTAVTGIATPSKGSPYAVTGTGTYNIITTGLAVLQEQILTATAATLWSAYVTTLCNSIIQDIATVIVNTEDSSTAEGVGVGAISLTGTSIFTTTMQDIFAYKESSFLSWETVATQIKNATKILLTTALINTEDSGSSPDPWTGTGKGSIS
jgi:hypothetical protein